MNIGEGDAAAEAVASWIEEKVTSCEREGCLTTRPCQDFIAGADAVLEMLRRRAAR